jgi:hypothetical protein
LDQPDHRVELSDGAIVVAPLQIHDASVVVGGDIFGIDPDRFAVVGHRAIVVAPGAIDVAAFVKSRSKISAAITG